MSVLGGRRRVIIVLVTAGLAVVVGCGGSTSLVARSGPSTSTSEPTSSMTADSATVPSTSPASTSSTATPATTGTPKTTPAPHAPSTPAPSPVGTTTPPTPTTLAYNQTTYPRCSAADLTAAARTDRTSYPAGVNVIVVVTVTNRGARACAYSQPGDAVTITDDSGTTVYPTAGFGQPGCPMGVAAMPPTYLLYPGESFDAGGATWDQLHHSCSGPDPGPRYPAGRYHASPNVYQGGPVTAITSAVFQLT